MATGVLFKTLKGKDAISFEGYRYRLDKQAANGTAVYFRCLTDGCSGRMKTDNEYNSIIVTKGIHNHPPTP